LAIVDPPYSDETVALDRLLAQMPGRLANAGVNRTDSLGCNAPTDEYFEQLFRVSKHQIIWGENWYGRYFGIGRIVWDKMNDGSNFSDCEIAYQSLNRQTRRFQFRWNGMLQENMANKEKRIHPTQKPVALYKWLLQNYAKAGDTILDTHLGSGSSRIAAYDLGFDFTGYELDTDYFNAQEARFANHIAQPKLWEPTQTPVIQETMFAN